MLRIPVRSRVGLEKSLVRMKTSSSFIRSTFIEYFVHNHGHKHVKSSSVVPLCDPSVPFVNAGMNQFKGVFLGKVEPPCLRAVNSQKCVRVGGKHNDLDVVGSDGHHHTFFEMLGNWSFGDYHKKEACKMAWDLLLGPYRFKPEDLVVTYFEGDPILGITEDRECRDIWKALGVQPSRLKALGTADNFWEMGATGPCGPCTEIHFVNPDGSLTEIWNIVFIQCNREADGSVKPLRKHHVDTGMGLERTTALIQGSKSNYNTDLFQPLIMAIRQNSPGAPRYGGRWGAGAALDDAFRRLADHARMLAVCLADGAFPNTNLNLKQIMRTSLRISTDVFGNYRLVRILYDEVAASLGHAYPELNARAKDAKLIIEHEEQAYKRLRSELSKIWRDLLRQHPEAEAMQDVEMAGFPRGYKEFKEVMSKQNSTVMPGELVFKLYDTHGFQEDVIERIAKLNNVTIDKPGFWKLLQQHKTRHKTAIQEQTASRAQMFDKAIENIQKTNITSTDDSHKYKYSLIGNEIRFQPLKTKLVAILNEEGEWIDFLEPAENKPYYLITKDTNFYCEEGGQTADTGVIHINKMHLKVDSVFKIRDFVFHKGCFTIADSKDNTLGCNSEVLLEIDSEKRLNTMRNHSAVHLLNAAVRKVLPDSVVCQTGSSVTDKGLSLNLSVYGQRLGHYVIMRAQDLIRKSIRADTPVVSRVVDSLQLSDSVLTVPGETYPETGLRVVEAEGPLPTKELCCGTHVPSTGHIGDLCVTLIKAAGGTSPNIHAITGTRATEARELFCKTHQLFKVIDLLDPAQSKEQVTDIKQRLSELCAGSGAPYAEYGQCLDVLDKVQKRAVASTDVALHAIVEEEIRDATGEALRDGRRFVVHFLRCSYIMAPAACAAALRSHRGGATPTLLLGCAQGVIGAVCTVPKEMTSNSFNAKQWLSSILPVFNAELIPSPDQDDTFAEMTGTKVSLITCEQLVQDALRAAISFASSHTTTHNSNTNPKLASAN